MKRKSSYHNLAYKQWITEKTLASLYDNAPSSLIGSSAVFVILAWFLWTQIYSLTLFCWSILGIFIFVARFALWLGYKKKKEISTPRFWLNSYRLMILGSGILFGVAMWLFFDGIPAEYQQLICLSIAGLTAAASGTHAVDLPTFLLFMLSSCILAITKLVFHGEASHLALSTMFILYVLVMGRTGQNNNRALLSNFKLTYSMHYRATHDLLVDLLNRTEFENLFAINTPLTHHGVAILFLDLDNFKPLNDTLGHQAGDRALKQVADIMVKALRADDPVARIGGDEFVTCLFLDDVNEVKKIADNILQRIQKMSFPGKHNYTGLSASIGIAFHHNNNVNYSQLLHAADSACYQSKERGKNQVTVVLAKE
ncbi:MAG: diguanylate cyclase, partial [Desulfobacterales bacterium]|nr:diguanylate cyclase [Desulfobacterales bacterium]